MIDYINEEQMKQWGMLWGTSGDRVKCKKCQRVIDYLPSNKYVMEAGDLPGIVTCKECLEK
jgi:hypothetical protein